MIAAPSHAPLRRRGLVGCLLIAAGLLLLGWTVWLALPGAAPHRYVQVGQGGAERFAGLYLEGLWEGPVTAYEAHVEGVAKPVATFHVAQTEHAGPVLLDWRNHGHEPLVHLGSDAEQTAALARAIATHSPRGSLILAWWDTSRQLQLLAGVDVVVGTHLGAPLVVPATWDDRRDAIERLERAFWGSAEADATASAPFEQFVDALVSDETSGVAALRALAGGREAYIVVHQADAYRAGLLRPAQFGVGYRDFPKSGDLHRLVRVVKSWVAAEGYTGYAVQARTESADDSSGRTRVYFLTDERSTQTLLARMLPFTTSNPLLLDELRLVFQHGGYWVYRLPGADTPAATTERHSP